MEEEIVKYKSYTLYSKDGIPFEMVDGVSDKIYNDDIWVNEKYIRNVYIKSLITRDENYIWTIALFDGYYYYIENDEVYRIREAIVMVDIKRTNFKLLDEI